MPQEKALPIEESRSPEQDRCMRRVRASRSDGLKEQAYNRAGWDIPLRDRATTWLAGKTELERARVEQVLAWFLCPVTLWPCNMRSLLEILLDHVEHGKAAPEELCLLIDLLPEPPKQKTIEVFAAHEHDVQAGRYEHYVPAARTKFQAVEKALAADSLFKADWRKITKAFDVARHADHKGVIRRTLVPERNLRQSFGMNWDDEAARFRAVFDTFCAKWNLYGMQKGKPLVLKLSVNLTAYGTMIFVPAYWSFDPKRDIRWGEVSKLHRARGQHRQGAAFAENAEQRRKDAARLVILDRKAREQGLRGAKRHEFLCHGLGWDVRTDPKRLAALRRLSGAKADKRAKKSP